MDPRQNAPAIDWTSLPSGTVLVVEGDDSSRDRWCTWFRQAGLNAVGCPGPSQPSQPPPTCRSCPLTDIADVVVMGLGGATGRTTLLTCPIQEAKLVLLSGPEDPVHVREDDHVAVLERPAERLELVDAVWQLLIDGRWAREEVRSHA